VQTNSAGQVVQTLKTAWRDGTTHLVMSPMEFMPQRIELPLCGSRFIDSLVLRQQWVVSCRPT
jgi:hypothetical protein